MQKGEKDEEVAVLQDHLLVEPEPMRNWVEILSVYE